MVTTLQSRIFSAIVLLILVGVLLVLVLTGHADPQTLTLFTSPVVVAVASLVLGHQLAGIQGGVQKTVEQTNGLLSGPLADIKATAESNSAKLDLVPGVKSGTLGTGA